jgi:hypothetical protein
MKGDPGICKSLQSSPYHAVKLSCRLSDCWELAEEMWVERRGNERQ